MRIGVIGVGGHSTTNLLPHARAAGLDLVATCARHIERARAVADRWGAAHAYDDAEQMLAEADVDGVVVCVQPWDYAPLIRLCLTAGKPVFCDKPGAGSSAEARELAGLSSTTGVPVVVGYMKRFAPAYQRAREIVQSPEFGVPSLASFTFAVGRGFGDDLRTYLIDNPVHPLDLARYIVGELDELEARVVDTAGGGFAVAAVARASSGAVCTFNLCTTASWSQQNERVEVYGAGHAVVVENIDTCIHRPPERPEHRWRPNYTVGMPMNSSPTISGFLPELEHFRQVAVEGASNRSDMQSAAATLALAERLCRFAGV
ncbi:Gfo/Idh/MocA family protein [Jiangella anatolica]|nr:Gfo/Idh/MocA family oxidoreductase [Jiangella anatolica]